MTLQTRNKYAHPTIMLQMAPWCVCHFAVSRML